MNWITRLYRAYLDRPDPAWRPTGIRCLTVRGYDEAQAVKSAKRAKRQTASGRKYPKPVTRRPATVTPFRKAAK